MTPTPQGVEINFTGYAKEKVGDAGTATGIKSFTISGGNLTAPKTITTTGADGLFNDSTVKVNTADKYTLTYVFEDVATKTKVTYEQKNVQLKVDENNFINILFEDTDATTANFIVAETHFATTYEALDSNGAPANGKTSQVGFKEVAAGLQVITVNGNQLKSPDDFNGTTDQIVLKDIPVNQDIELTLDVYDEKKEQKVSYELTMPKTKLTVEAIRNLTGTSPISFKWTFTQATISEIKGELLAGSDATSASALKDFNVDDLTSAFKFYNADGTPNGSVTIELTEANTATNTAAKSEYVAKDVKVDFSKNEDDNKLIPKLTVKLGDAQEAVANVPAQTYKSDKLEVSAFTDNKVTPKIGTAGNKITMITAADNVAEAPLKGTIKLNVAETNGTRASNTFPVDTTLESVKLVVFDEDSVRYDETIEVKVDSNGVGTFTSTKLDDVEKAKSYKCAVNIVAKCGDYTLTGTMADGAAFIIGDIDITKDITITLSPNKVVATPTDNMTFTITGSVANDNVGTNNGSSTGTNNDSNS